MSKRILIIDDNEIVLRIIKHILGAKDYKIDSVNTGEAGITNVKESPPDLVLLDVVLPSMDGWEVCRQLKEDEETKSIPIIMMTGVKVDDEDKKKSYGAGADDYVTKPFSKDVLLGKVEAYLDK